MSSLMKINVTESQVSWNSCHPKAKTSAPIQQILSKLIQLLNRTFVEEQNAKVEISAILPNVMDSTK